MRAEAARETTQSSALAIDHALRDRSATAVTSERLELRTTCATRSHPDAEKGTLDGWREPLTIACAELRAFQNLGTTLEAATGSGKRVLIVNGWLARVIGVSPRAPDQLLAFRVVTYPEKSSVRYITQCGTCSGLSDAWAEGLPAERRVSAFVFEDRNAENLRWVEVQAQNVEVSVQCVDRPPE